MAKNANKITLGVGVLSIRENNIDEDVGYLAGDVILSVDTNSLDFQVGTPKQTVKRVITSFETALKASLAQIDADSIKQTLGIGTVASITNGKRITFGSSWELPTLTNVKFVHTRPNGGTVTVVFPKAMVKPGSYELKFSNDSYLVQDITISAISDGTSASYPYIEEVEAQS